MFAVATRPSIAASAPGRAVARLADDHPARAPRPVALRRPAAPRAAPRTGTAARIARSVGTVAVGMAGGFAIVSFVSAFAASAAVVAVLAL